MRDSEVNEASPKTSLQFPDEEEQFFEGRPFPAFDVEEVLAPQTISFDYSIDISNFFDGVDDNENVRMPDIESKSTEKRYSVENIKTKKQKINKPLKSQVNVNLHGTSQTHTEVELARVNQRRTKIKKQEDCSLRRRLHKANKMYSGAVLATPKLNEILEKKTTNTRSHRQIQKSSLQNPFPLAKNVPKDLSYEDRLLSSKRKLQESYKEADNVKMRRKAKLIDFQKLPSQQFKRRSCKV